jgi:hypothetical protein
MGVERAIGPDNARLGLDQVDVQFCSGVAAPHGNQRVHRAAQHYDAEVGKTGLKGTQYSLLSYVVKLGPIRTVDLATAMRVSTSRLSRNLQPLIASGWLCMH